MSLEPAIFFWGHKNGDYNFMSQWYPGVPFFGPSSTDDKVTLEFNTAEQYMMYHKAITFDDFETADEVMAATSPKEQKALGRKIKGFQEEVWDERKIQVVVEGNMLKFGGHSKKSEQIRKKLLDTEERLLVEASPYDRIWGIGFAIHTAEANRSHWGQNLLGKALMEVRQRLRATEKDENKGTEQEI